MSVALAGRAPQSFEIKSATLPLVSLLLKSADLSLLSRELEQRFGDAPDFFDHDPLLVDLSRLPSGTVVDFAELIALLRQRKLAPLAVTNGAPRAMNDARSAGLVAAPDAVPALPAPPPREGWGGGADALAALAEAAADLSAIGSKAEKPSNPTPTEPAPAPGALVIDRPLRSGQQVYARGRDLVVMCMVNAGAEVIADGHIHVWAPLRGKAIAGACGDTAARILALGMEPELISIAGVYRTSDVPLPDAMRGRPTQVRLVGGAGEGKLVMEPLASIDPPGITPAPFGGGLGWGRARTAGRAPTQPSPKRGGL